MNHLRLVPGPKGTKMSAISQNVMTTDVGINLERLKEPFREDEVEFRLAQCGEGRDGVWAKALAYITSRAIMDRLDSVCGAGNWKVSYEFVGTTGVICNLSIFVNGGWITKQDGAEMTEIESFKGGISSALKRAGSAWGMGRYLYSLESDFLPEGHIFEKQRDGAYYGKTKTGKQFYWLPPKLPAWALPKSDKPTQTLVCETSPEDSERKTLYSSLMEMHKPYLKKFPDNKFNEVLKARYNGVEEVKKLDLGQLKDFESYISHELNSKPISAPIQARISQTKIVHEKTAERKPSDAQLKRLYAIHMQSGLSDAQVKTYIQSVFGKQTSKDLSLSEYDYLCDSIVSGEFASSEAKNSTESPSFGTGERSGAEENSVLKSNVVAEEDLPWNGLESQSHLI